MRWRSFERYKRLFEKYEELCLDQTLLCVYPFYILPSPENKKQYDDLQVKKISILEEMEKIWTNSPLT